MPTGLFDERTQLELVQEALCRYLYRHPKPPTRVAMNPVSLQRLKWETRELDLRPGPLGRPIPTVMGMEIEETRLLAPGEVRFLGPREEV